MKKALCYGLLISVVGIGAGGYFWPPLLYAFVLVAPLCAIAIYDLTQGRHTILRNYPIVGHIRYLMEDVHTRIRQYLIESETSPP